MWFAIRKVANVSKVTIVDTSSSDKEEEQESGPAKDSQLAKNSSLEPNDVGDHQAQAQRE